ncbi:MAG: phosphatidate cytidylyltransferase [Synergistaceae bacterium]|jgi:phosphatidate cytidylyltransferase|nr:phosphatidate cytidylyltransferase [Synergistaceae bacterium]
MALHKPPSGVKSKQSRKGAASDIFNRVMGSVLVCALIVGGIMAGKWIWPVMASIVALGSLLELYQMMSSKFRLSRGWGLAGAFLMLLSVSIGLSYAVTLSIIAVVAFIVLFTEVVRRQSTGQSYALWNMGGTLSGLIYIILPWCFMIEIRSQTWGYIFLLTIFFSTWSCDVGAYIVGSRFGQTPFAFRVSPKKSWEGFWAGLGASIVCGSVMPIFVDFAPLPIVLISVLCGVAGQIGDLGESVLKREAGIKDSGSVIPGHGGFLDRFDSILINATLAFFIFEVIS